MTAYDLAVYAAVALLIAAILLVPRVVSFRRRLVVGTLFFIAGWAGIFGGLAMGDQPFLKSEIAALLWMGCSSLLLVASVVFLVTAAVDWIRLKRGSRKRL